MNPCFVLQKALAAGLAADPVLCLAYAAAWLDPLRGDADDINTGESEDDTVLVALHILRQAFPETYFDALQAIRHGASYTDLDRLICAAISAQGIPLENLEWIGWGIPLPAYGAVLDDPDFYTAHPDVLPVLACFGISPEPNPYSIVIPEVTYKVANLIANDLLKQGEQHWRQVGWLVKWLFSETGNSSCDYDYETLAEFQPLTWEAEDIAFARELIEEADSIMADVRAGLKWVEENPALFVALETNIQRSYKTMAKTKGKQDRSKVHLKWEI